MGIYNYIEAENFEVSSVSKNSRKNLVKLDFYCSLLVRFSLKLLKKKGRVSILICKVNYDIYYICLIISIIFMLLFWSIVRWFTNIYRMNYSNVT